MAGAERNVNFYKHHIGDYDQATAHLSFVEDAAYSRMLRKYYADERPLPVDVKAVQRLLRARSKDERRAVSDVLKEFFELREDGWHSKRCDSEIFRANAQAEINRGIAAQREKNRKSLKSLDTSSTNRARKANESSTVTCEVREPIQTPDSRLQTLELESKTSTPNGVVLQAAPATIPKRSWIEQAKDVIDFLNWKLSRAWSAVSPQGKPTANAIVVIARLKDGYTVDDCKTVASLKIEQWFDDDKMRQFLRPSTLYRPSHFADYLGETKRLPEAELRRIRIANGFQPHHGSSQHAH